jgi:hypothetical protein
MARGWESKAVADQIEEGKAELERRHAAAPSVERHRQSRLESLRLSRSRLLEQLEKARHPAHREMLMKGLGAVESEIEAVSVEEVED